MSFVRQAVNCELRDSTKMLIHGQKMEPGQKVNGTTEK